MQRSDQYVRRPERERHMRELHVPPDDMLQCCKHDVCAGYGAGREVREVAAGEMRCTECVFEEFCRTWVTDCEHFVEDRSDEKTCIHAGAGNRPGGHVHYDSQSG